MPEIKQSDFIDAKALAEHLGIDYGTLRNMLRDGEAKLPPCIRIGHRRKWRLSVVEEWIEKNMDNPDRV